MPITKRILVLTPDSPDPRYLEAVIQALDFLRSEYHIQVIDSLEIMEPLSNSAFYQAWQDKLEPLLPSYQAFFGFSFGGVILQHCLPLFQPLQKPIIFCSTPSFSDLALSTHLKKVIHLCRNQQLPEALNYLYQQVYAPNKPPKDPPTLSNPEQAAQRIMYGLERVLHTDSRALLAANKVKYLHLIGECSQLVTANTVCTDPPGVLKIVPQAGMRVLGDNSSFCQDAIWEALNETY